MTPDDRGNVVANLIVEIMDQLGVREAANRNMFASAHTLARVLSALPPSEARLWRNLSPCARHVRGLDRLTREELERALDLFSISSIKDVLVLARLDAARREQVFAHVEKKREADKVAH